MARVMGKLNALAVTQAKARGYYSDGGGLYLQVSAGGAKSWVFRFHANGKLREMGLGPQHTVSLAEARMKAQDCRKARLGGDDPIEQRTQMRLAAKIAAASAKTFRQCADAYIDSHQHGWRNPKHAKQWPATLEAYAYPAFGDLPVAAVDVGLVLHAIQPIWTTKPETASRVRGRIESVLDWATARGYRAGDNPARWRGHLENLLPKKSKVRAVKHHAALPYSAIGTFIADLRQQEGIAACALEFAILTAARTSEVTGARWDEIDLANKLWVIPGARMKAGKEHRVPLSAAAVGIVERMAEIRSGDFVFPGGRADCPLSNMAFLMTLRRMGRADLTVHGFRSTFSDWCAERTAFPAEVREMALAHVIGDKAEAAYRRGDLFEKRRQLAEAWATFCAAPPSSADVIALRQA